MISPFWPLLATTAQIIKLLQRRTLCCFAQRLLVIILTFSLACPSPALAGSFAFRESLSWNAIWAQLKAAVTKDEPPLQDPLERPEPEIKPQEPRENKATLEARVTKLKSELPNKLELYVGQRYRLSVVPTDNNGSAIHGLKAEYETSDTQIVLVDKDGEVLAGNL